MSHLSIAVLAVLVYCGTVKVSDSVSHIHIIDGRRLMFQVRNGIGESSLKHFKIQQMTKECQCV